MDEINGYLDQLKSIDLSGQIEGFTKHNIAEEIKSVRRIQRQIDDATSKLAVLTEEVPKAIMGESSFDSELLSTLIRQKDQEILMLKSQLEEAEEALSAKKIELDEMKAVQSYIPIWRDVFNDATIERKKMMLASIIERIIVRRDKIEVRLKLHIRDFIGVMADGESALKVVANNRHIKNKILSHQTLAVNI